MTCNVKDTSDLMKEAYDKRNEKIKEYASEKLNMLLDAAEIIIPILPDVRGYITPLTVGVKVKPVPSASILEDNLQIIVVDACVGRICIRASYELKSTGALLESLYSILKFVVAPCSNVNEYLPAAIFTLYNKY